MLTEQLDSLPIVGGKLAFTTTEHPLGPLTGSEILESSRLIKTQWPSNTEIQFKAITLKEPVKADLVAFLVAERAGKKTPQVERKSSVVYYLRNTVGWLCLFNNSPANSGAG